MPFAWRGKYLESMSRTGIEHLRTTPLQLSGDIYSMPEASICPECDSGTHMTMHLVSEQRGILYSQDPHLFIV